MAARALIPATAVSLLAGGVAYLANGWGSALSAVLGVDIVAGTFVAYVLVLGWARGISPAALQIAVMVGWLVRLGIFVGVLLALKTTDWFDVAAFGLAGVVAALAVAMYEARLWLHGIGDVTPASPGDRERDRAGAST